MKRSHLWGGLVLILLLLLCFGLLSTGQAVDPPPGGGYPGENTAAGDSALRFLTNGVRNTALGFWTLARNNGGGFNTAIGDQALLNNVNAVENTATGVKALQDNGAGTDNTANGRSSLSSNKGRDNTAIGALALFNNTTGHGNIAVGRFAGLNLTTGSNNINIRNEGVAGEGSTIRIGDGNQRKTFITGISGAVVTNAAVYVNAAGQLGTAPSSQRFKDEIKPMGNASEAILALEPVTFRYKKELDPQGTAQFGLLAEQVEKVNPDLIVRDAEGKPYSVRYDAVNVMLLNEFLKHHRTVENLESGIAQLTAHLEEQDSKIQKISDQFGISKSSSRVAAQQ